MGARAVMASGNDPEWETIDNYPLLKGVSHGFVGKFY
jgi:hypothetical protein